MGGAYITPVKVKGQEDGLRPHFAGGPPPQPPLVVQPTPGVKGGRVAHDDVAVGAHLDAVPQELPAHEPFTHGVVDLDEKSKLPWQLVDYQGSFILGGRWLQHAHTFHRVSRTSAEVRDR
jgi:hypothetical protein